MIRLLIVLSGFFTLALSAQISIAVGDKADSLEKMAAAELSEHLSAAVGKKIPVVTGNPAGKVIYVGSHPQAVKIAGNKKYDKEEWAVMADGRDRLAVTGGKPRGVIYAAYEFLESQMGVIWLDEWSTHIPKVAEITWPANLKMSGKPAFLYRGVYAYFGAPQYLFYRFLARNRQNHFHDRRINSGEAFARGVSSVTGSPRACHTFFQYSEDWSNEDEKCFSWSDGQKKYLRAKNSSGPGQVCLTNPRTYELFMAKLRKYIAHDGKFYPAGYRPEIYCIMPNDNNGDCRCANCMKAAARYGRSGILLNFVNRMAREIRMDHPDLKIMTMAYMDAKMPPKNVKAEPNVIVEIALLGGEYSGESRQTHRSYNHPCNAMQRKLFEDWSKVASLGVWDYWVLYAERGRYPATNAVNIVENLRFYKKMKVDFMFAECEWEQYTSLHALRLWLGLRMMNNLELDEQKEIDRFLNAYYGKAAPYVRQYHDMLQKGNSSVKGSLCDLPLNRRTDLDVGFFRKAEQLFTAAEKAEAGNPAILERLGRERISIDLARIDKRSQLPADLQPSVREAAERFKKNYTAAVNRYVHANERKTMMDSMNDIYVGITADIPPLKGFEDKQVIADFGWPALSAHRNTTVINDPEAAGGKAVAMTGNEGRTAEDKKKCAENRGLKMGVYAFQDRIHLAKTEIAKEVLPKDEKYHWYALGRVKLVEKCFLWMHWSWLSQHRLISVYDPSGLNNDVEIFVHIKVQGPLYVKGSEKPNIYAIDRVVVCKAGVGGTGPVDQALPQELRGRKAYVDLVGTSLPEWRYAKVYDADSAAGAALRLDKQSSHQGREFAVGIYDEVKRQIVVRVTPKVPQDEKYHLISLGVRPVPRRGYIFAHSSGLLRVDFKFCTDPVNPNRKYEIVLSVKLTGPAYVKGSKKQDSVSIDRLLLLEPKTGR